MRYSICILNPLSSKDNVFSLSFICESRNIFEKSVSIDSDLIGKLDINKMSLGKKIQSIVRETRI